MPVATSRAPGAAARASPRARVRSSLDYLNLPEPVLSPVPLAASTENLPEIPVYCPQYRSRSQFPSSHSTGTGTGTGGKITVTTIRERWFHFVAVPPRRVAPRFFGLQVLLRRPGFGLTMSASRRLATSRRPRPGLNAFAPPPANYMSVKDAILEQAEQRGTRMNQPQLFACRLLGGGAMKAAQQQSMHGPRAGPPRSASRAQRMASCSHPQPCHPTSVAMDGAPPGSPSARGHVRRALGAWWQQQSGLNHTSTYFYGEALSTRAVHRQHVQRRRPYRCLPQALSERNSSGAFGFGTSTRQLMNTYISPAYLKDCYGKFAVARQAYAAVVARWQVLDSKAVSIGSFGLEERSTRTGATSARRRRLAGRIQSLRLELSTGCRRRCCYGCCRRRTGVCEPWYQLPTPRVRVFVFARVHVRVGR